MKAAEASARVTLQNVLFLTDFSQPSEAALPFAVGIARAYGAKIFVLHVLRPDPLLYSTPPSAVIAQRAQEESAEVEMQRIESSLAGLPHETFVEWGDGIWLNVEETLKNCAIDLVVLGTHGRTGAEKFLLGSVAEEIFRRSPVPVLTIGPAVRRGMHNDARFHNILFATDFSSHSLAAMPYALSFAQENQAHLTLLHIVPETAADSVTETEIASLHWKLNNLVPEQAKLWCELASVVDKGRPATRLLEMAKQRGADLIVLGIRASQHPGSATHLAGATAHKVVSHAECPVLTVRE